MATTSASRDLVLVTGGAGYIGSVLVPRLLARSYQVRVLDKLVFSAAGLGPVQDRIELVQGDIRDLDPGILDGVGAIVHLAGLSNDPTAEFDPRANATINTDGTLHLARLARERRVGRFLFASSCSVYHTFEPDDAIRDESHPIDPRAPYSQSKYQAERGLLHLADDDFHPVILRKGTVFGPSPRMRYDLVVNTFTRDAFRARRLTVHAGGRMWRPLLNIEDCADAYLACLEAPEDLVHGEVFNVLSGNHQVLAIAREIRRALETSQGVRLELDVQQVGAARSYRVSAAKIDKVLGVHCQRSIGDSAEAMWATLAAGLDPDDPVYDNIRWLELLSEMRDRLAEMGGSPL